ncbi:hypothetical protein [Rhodococcus ruber]|uniref:hypothetical protein n=1 Tax=Rhodococcus ruber TaxID=1830 RepID=UPI0011AB667D|nr:hypothetical protein [Rhodococcus ruber]
MFVFTRRRTDSSGTESGGEPTPRVDDARLGLDRVSGIGVVSVPNRWDRIRAVVAGHGDGRHGLLPDPECGHTQHTARIADEFGSTVDSEQLELTRRLSRIDELTERLTTEAAQLRVMVEALDGQVLGLREADERVEPSLDTRRRERDLMRRQAERQERVDKLDSRIRQIERDLAGVARMRSYQISACAQRIDRARVTRQQLIDVYWRWFVRTHPEESAVRAGYPIPSVDRPAVTAVVTPPRH